MSCSKFCSYIFFTLLSCTRFILFGISISYIFWACFQTHIYANSFHQEFIYLACISHIHRPHHICDYVFHISHLNFIFIFLHYDLINCLLWNIIYPLLILKVFTKFRLLTKLLKRPDFCILSNKIFYYIEFILWISKAMN